MRQQGREIGVSEATALAAAVQWYEHSAKAGFWLANHHDELSHDQRMAFSHQEARGLSEAAKVLASLKIDRVPADSSLLITLRPTGGQA